MATYEIDKRKTQQFKKLWNNGSRHTEGMGSVASVALNSQLSRLSSMDALANSNSHAQLQYGATPQLNYGFGSS